MNMNCIAAFVLVTFSALSSATELMLYQGNELVTTSELAVAFKDAQLRHDRISVSHYEVIKKIYSQKGVDFIGLVEEEREPKTFIINERPYWSIDENLMGFLEKKPTSLSDLKTKPMLNHLRHEESCLRIFMTGPESFTLELIRKTKADLLDPEELICPD